MAVRTVILDPGHGGTAEVGNSSPNNATSFSGALERDLTLEFALLVAGALSQLSTPAQTLNIVMTRTTDVNIGLLDRAACARTHKAERFLSIHFNGFDKKARGVETLIRPVADGNVNIDEDRKFAKKIQAAVLAALRKHDATTRDRGVKEQKLGVLADPALGNTAASHPCRACLVEIEFIDVDRIDKLLVTGPKAPLVRVDIATAMAKAILDDLLNP